MDLVLALNIPPTDVRNMTAREMFALQKIMKGKK